MSCCLVRSALKDCLATYTTYSAPLPMPRKLWGGSGTDTGQIVWQKWRFTCLLANRKPPWSHTDFYTRAVFVAFSDSGACDCVFYVFTIASSFCYSPTSYLSLNFITRTSQHICLARTLCCTIGILYPDVVQVVCGEGIWKPCTDWIFVRNASRPTPLLKCKRLTFVGGLNYLPN